LRKKAKGRRGFVRLEDFNEVLAILEFKNIIPEEDMIKLLKSL